MAKLTLKKTIEQQTAERVTALLKQPVQSAMSAVEQLQQFAAERGGRDALLAELGDGAADAVEIFQKTRAFVADVSDETTGDL